jgi:hypothetical protein
MLVDLVELRHGPESDDYGLLRPTDHAFERSSDMLVDAAVIAAVQGRKIPGGCVSTDSEGGVRVEWIRSDRSTHLIIPPSSSQAAFVYHEVARDFATEDATPEALAQWLRDIE